MNIKMLWFEVLLTCIIIFHISTAQKNNTVKPPAEKKQNKLKWGPYVIKTNYLEKCILPNKIDPVKLSSWKLSIYKVSRKKEEIRGYIYIPVTVNCTKGTINGDEYNNGGYKPYFKIESKDPCKHRLFEPLMRIVMSVDKKTCLIKAGNYTVQGFDTDALVHWYSGNNFFYNKSIFELNFFGDTGSIFCVRAAFESKPPKK